MSLVHAAPAPQKERLWYLDNLKVALTFLVIAHHVGQAYGPTGGFWAYMNSDRWPYLGFFFWVNASFFMGLFFFISAYFLPGTFDRKGALHLLKDRALRMGLPLIIFVLLINPVMMYVSYVNFRGGDISFWSYLTQIYFGLGPKPENFTGPSWPDVNFGHLWFIEHLLVYSLLYAGYRWLARRREPVSQTAPVAPSDLAILGYTIGLIAVSAVVRIWYPIDHWLGILGFIQAEPAHLPQYVSFFVLGMVAYRQRWFAAMPAVRGWRWLGVGIASIVVAGVLSFVVEVPWGGELFLTLECFIAVGMGLGLVTLFRSLVAQTGRLWQWFSANAYGAYLVHVPVVVALQYGFHSAPLGALGRFLMVTLLGIPLSFLASQLLRKLPGVARYV